MNYICTWICVDNKEQESYFPQTGKLSSSKDHQAVYWRCVMIFFITSIRFNPHNKHLLFTNSYEIPNVDGRDIRELLGRLGVEIIVTDFKYRTPKDYYFSFQNQFYEFSILEHISGFRRNADDNYLILDSDCVFLAPADKLFAAAAPQGFISFEDDVLPDYVINGLSCNDLHQIYRDLLDKAPVITPTYHLGEFFLANFLVIEKLSSDFEQLWPVLLKRNQDGKKKFNEEAHTLSFLYYKNNLRAGVRDSFIKRIWTNPVFYRNVQPTDINFPIWHLPAEKLYGLRKLYDILMEDPKENFCMSIPDEQYRRVVQKTMGVPRLSVNMFIKYYSVSIFRALVKRWQKLASRQTLSSAN